MQVCIFQTNKSKSSAQITTKATFSYKSQLISSIIHINNQTRVTKVSPYHALEINFLVLFITMLLVTGGESRYLLEAILPPKPEIPKVELPPLPEIPKDILPPKPEIPRIDLPALPEIPKDTLPPKPEIPNVELPPLPEIPKDILPPKLEMPKVQHPPLPEIPRSHCPRSLRYRLRFL
jgi:hypothetical protein